MKWLPGWKQLTSARELDSHQGPVVVGVSRDVSMSGDASTFAGWLYANLMGDRESLLRNRENIDIAWEGFDHDRRELWEIPEVVAFVEDLNERWPCALYFLSRLGHGLQVMQFCLLNVSAVGTAADGVGTAQVNRVELGHLLETCWLPALNQVSELAGLDASTVSEMTDSAVEYLLHGPA